MQKPSSTGLSGSLWPASSGISRRSWLATALGAIGAGAGGWVPAFGEAVASSTERKRRCVLLWMTGGPSQTDTFDMKPDHANGGEFEEIATSAPGLRFSEHLPRLAKLAHHLAVFRGMSTGEGDHGRGTYRMRTGRAPDGVIEYPTLGSVISREIEAEAAVLPGFVSVASGQNPTRNAFQPGFLGPRHAPLAVDARRDFRTTEQLALEAAYAELTVADLHTPAEVGLRQAANRVDLLRSLQTEFVTVRGGGAATAHHTTVERAVRMVHGAAAEAFDLSREPDDVREKYGRGRFGQGCLLARRLVERDVAFVEVCLGDQGRWDTHTANFPTVQALSQELDAGWSSLMEDLEVRGLLDSTTILWMGEFGRTPQINGSAGRDHYPQAWSAVLAGGGIRGGQAYGKTDAGGTDVIDGAVDVGGLLATLCLALGIDPKRQNVSEEGRRIRIVEGEPVREVLA